MHFVIIVALIVIVCGRGIPKGYHPEPPNERYERRYISMSQSDIREDNQNRQITINNHEHNRHADSDVPNTDQEQIDDGVTKIVSINLAFERQINQNRHGNINLPRQSFSIDTQYPNRDFANDQRNNNNQQNRHIDFNNCESVHHSKNANTEEFGNNNGYNRRGSSLNQREMYSSRGNMAAHAGFSRQRSPIRGGVTNTPRSFGTNNEYVDMHDITNYERQRNNKPNDMQPTRQQHDMIFNNDDEYNKRKVLDKTNEKDNSVTNTNHTVKSVISFINKDRNANQDAYDMRHNISSKNVDVSGSPNKVHAIDQIPSKTTIENEVTSDPFQVDSIKKEYETTGNERWVWGDDDKLATVTTVAPPTIDDRAAFAGDKCATGMARVAGKCILTDK